MNLDQNRFVLLDDHSKCYDIDISSSDSGFGVIDYIDGSKYYGQIKNRMREGFGEYIDYDSGIYYIGLFINNQK